MTARRRRRRARSRTAAAAKKAPRPSPPSPAPLTAEPLLLALARQISAASGTPGDAATLSATIQTCAAAYAPDAPLATALRDDWLQRHDDKTARLALAWAREQVRLALVETLQRARAARLVRSDTDADTLAWLSLAACEALAHEPPGAVADRVHALTVFLAGGPRVIESR